MFDWVFVGDVAGVDVKVFFVSRKLYKYAFRTTCDITVARLGMKKLYSSNTQSKLLNVLRFDLRLSGFWKTLYFVGWIIHPGLGFD